MTSAADPVGARHSADLMGAFLLESGQNLAGLAAGVRALRVGHAPEQMDTLALLYHRVRGSAALYGLPQMSSLAALGERLLEGRPELPPAQRRELLEVLSCLGVCLQAALDGVAGGRGEGEVGLTFARLGGTARLQALLRASPAAFRPPAPAGMDAAPVAPAAPHTLEDGLRHFRQQHAEVWSYFAPEIREHLGALRAGLSEGADADVTLLFRAAHTIKGSAYMVGLNALGDLGHSLEHLLSAVRGGERTLDAAARSILTEAAAAAERLLRAAEGEPESGDLAPLLTTLGSRLGALADGTLPGPGAEDAAPAPAAAAPQTSAVPTRQASVRVETARLEGLLDLVADLVAARARLSRTLTRFGELAQTLEAGQARLGRTVRDFEERYLNPDMVRAELPAARPGTPGQNLSERFGELEFDSYSDLNILARAVAELAADFGEVRGQFAAGVDELRGEDERLGKALRTLRREVSGVSRVPFGQATARLRRWARTRGEEHFTLQVEGEREEVDASLLQDLVDPLLHLSTNAVNHGLEPAAERRAAGKPERGTVWVRARAQGHHLEVEVRDDGRGIDLAAVRAQALTRGLRSGAELQALSDRDALQLVTLPGLSTAREVTAEAGRGVGMDVVASNLRRLGGDLHIQSEPGVGTAFTLRVPLAVRVADVLHVRVGDQPVGIGTAQVLALRAVEPGDVQSSPEGLRLRWNGGELPFYPLRPLWGLPEAPSPFAAVLHAPAGPVAVAVDELRGIEEVALRPLEPLLAHLPFLAGAAVAGSGEALPLLDAPGLAGHAGRPALWATGEAAAAAAPARTRVLLIDDSISVRRLVGRMLERGGHEVVTAHDGQAALDLIQQGAAFDLVLTDLEMPRVNGYEVLGALRARPQTARTPIVVMTTRAGEKHQRLATELGASDYFSKPVDEALLLRRVARLCAGGAA